MPGGDHTGPHGSGPRTGRGLGYCCGYGQPGSANPASAFRSGFGRGGLGRGWRHRFYASGVPSQAPAAAGQQAEDLQAQAERLRAQLDAVQKRIEALDK